MSHEGATTAQQPNQEEPEIERPVAPAFIKEFSRENSAEERSALAEKIRAERGEHFEKRREQDELNKQIENLEKKLEEYNSDSFLNKIGDYFKMRSVRESLGIAQERKAEVDSSVASRDPNRFGQEEIEKLYENEKKKWANSEYGKEDIAKFFTEENLASLSMEDYALLMKRFPSEMVTHVTRQGIRDHTGMAEHSAGKDAFHNGFEKILDDGNLKSPLAVKLVEGQKESVILNCLRYGEWSERAGELPKTRDEALERLKTFLESGYGAYTDQAAIHFAAEEVANFFYGSEKGNEIFIAYPSAFIGSQYHFSHADIAPDHIDSMHNDAWVFTQEERGIKLNSALVFLPQDARVDPKNGSRYDIGPDNKPTKNEAYGGLERLAASPEFETIVQQIMERLVSLSSDNLPPPSTWENELEKPDWDAYSHKDVLKALLPIRDKIKETSGIVDDRILKRIFNYTNARSLKYANTESSEDERGRKINLEIDQILQQAGTRFVEAQNTVSSEEYWNQYFATRPDKKPSKVVFYSGGDPTKAMRDWKQQYGLTKESADKSVGFKEHVATSQEEQIDSVRERANRFESLARVVIDEKYPEIEISEVPIEEQPPPLPPQS